LFAASQRPGVCGAEICLSDSRSFHSRRGARANLSLIDTLDIVTENGLVRIGGEMEVAMENGTRCAWAGGTIIYPQSVPPEDSLTRPGYNF